MSSRRKGNEGGELRGFITRIPGQVSSAIGFVTLVVGTATSLAFWLGGNSTTAVYIGIVLFLMLVWEVALFVILKRRASQVYSVKKGKQARIEHLFGARSRALALASAVVLSVGSGLWYFRQRSPQKAPSNRTIIMVADFQSLDGRNFGVTEKLIEQLRESTKEFPDIDVQALNRSISAQEGKDVARAVAKEKNATLLLWGWYVQNQQTALVTAHFETLKQPHSLRLRNQREELRVPANSFDSFELQIRLSNEMTYLTLLTIGLARFEAGNNKGAIELFNKALDQNSVPDQMIDPANIYFFRGTAFLNL